MTSSSKSTKEAGIGPGSGLIDSMPSPWNLDELDEEIPELESEVAEEEPEDEIDALEGEPKLEEGPTPEELAALEHARELEKEYERGLAEGRKVGYEEGRREGYEVGIRDGVVEGQQEASKRLSSLIAALEEALFEVRIAEEGRLSQIESNLAALAVAVARQIIGRELRGDAEAIADRVRHALVEFPIDQPLRIRLAPQDLSTIASLSQPGGEAIAIAPGRDLRWIADPNLEPGSCIVEGTERVVDGRIDKALERIYRRLTDG